MEQIDEKERIVSLTLRVRQEDKEQFDEIRHSLGDPIHAEVFSQIVTRYNMPMRANEEAARQAADLRQQLDQANLRIEQLTQQLADAEAAANHPAEAAEQQQLAFDEERARLQQQAQQLQPTERQRLVDFLPHCLRALDAVAERESKRRNQHWTISQVINFFVQSRFIDGQLNGDLAALSDAECRRLDIPLRRSNPNNIEI